MGSPMDVCVLFVLCIVPNVAGMSGVSINDCAADFLQHVFT
jgi:hypothetical protein